MKFKSSKAKKKSDLSDIEDENEELVRSNGWWYL
jgi:hypothetical protein